MQAEAVVPQDTLIVKQTLLEPVEVYVWVGYRPVVFEEPSPQLQIAEVIFEGYVGYAYHSPAGGLNVPLAVALYKLHLAWSTQGALVIFMV